MNINKDISKGGLLGALIGTIASTQIHKPEENTTRKVIKTGVFAGLGYALGAGMERIFRQRKENK